jgi:fumarylacetoacetate (FAA) hydrolase
LRLDNDTASAARDVKLLTYEATDKPDGPRAGILLGDRVCDVAPLLGHQGIVRDVRAVLELPGEPLEQLKTAAQSVAAEDGVPLHQVRLRAPVLQPPTVRDFMVYEGHASGGGTRQLSDAWYRLPIFYFSNPLCIFGPDDSVPYPSASEMLDYELEIGAVIAREGRNVSAEDGLSYVAGFTIFNDWSCRDLQRDEMEARLGPAKGKDAASSLGPWVVTTDELTPHIRDNRLHVKCTVTVNGALWMENNAGIMYHSWGDMIERATRDSRIAPGDVLGSGTVTGGTIGEAIRGGLPARYLQVGDVVEIEVEGIGVLRNTIAPKVDPDLSYRFKAPATSGIFP